MAKATLIVYEPLNRFGQNRGYWSNYIDFYEKYWGGPTSPHAAWFGREYETFREALSKHLEMEEGEIEDCLFMKDKEGYYVAPFGPQNPCRLYAENSIPLHWFIPFKDEERESFYSHWGFGGIHYDAKIHVSLERLKEADEIIRKTAQKKTGLKLPLFHRLSEIQDGATELQTWLLGFDPSGYVLLNYGEICSFIHPYTIKNERSAKEIWQVLSLIKEGKIDEAESMLNVITQKWEDIRRKAAGDIDKFTIQ